jgi:3-dehydroquinate dehydratase/shikimate dehydrogenase
MARTLLCATVTGSTMSELIAARDAAAAADMVELRLDGVLDLDVAGALRGRRKPVVVTCRPVWEGGRFDGSEDARVAVLSRALALDAEYVDIEWRALSTSKRLEELLRLHRPRVLVSMHDFAGVPNDLLARVRTMRSAGAALVKVAVTAARLTDTLPLLDIARAGDAVVVAMGDPGVPSRLLAARYGSRWTYAGDGIAPGQIPAERMVGQYGFRRVGPGTRLFGVVGTNAMHSLSPALHNAAFEAGGLDAVYVPLPTASFDDFLTYADAIGIEGASVTIPFKRDALRAADDADARTRRVGAANTLRRVQRGEQGAVRQEHGASQAWEATNTDIDGFLEPLDAALHIPLRDLRVSVLGAGGAARAVVVALQSRGARVTIHARREEQAREVASELRAAVGPWPPRPGSWDVLVNCTPLGSAGLPEVSPMAGEPLAGLLVYDLTYGAGESRLLREARAAGTRTLDGLPMLVAQAERQFEWWIGQPPRAGVMEAAARQRLDGADSGARPRSSMLAVALGAGSWALGAWV